jgi:hypothetical protein
VNKVKLYHGTRIDCKDRIIEIGIEPNITEASSHISDDERFLQSGIFGFDNLDDAISFAADLCESSGVAVFSFNIDNALVDPEYNGESYFVPTEENVNGILEFECMY